MTAYMQSALYAIARPSICLSHGWISIQSTWKLSYHKDDCAMHPMYRCPENFREPQTKPTATFPTFSMGFCFDRSYESMYKFLVHSFIRFW